MKRVLPFLIAALLLISASAQATSGLSALFEGLQTTAESQQATEEPAKAEEAAPSEAAETASFPMTAQQWILSFQLAANVQGLSLGRGFSYEPGMYTGQHSYDIDLADTPAYFIGMSVFSDDGVEITICSMRLASAMLTSRELVQADDTLWRAIRAMITASDPEAAPDEIVAICEALCPDLPAVLMREATVDVSVTQKGLRYSLWAGFNEDAFYGDASTPSSGYIVDFVVEADVPEDVG